MNNTVSLKPQFKASTTVVLNNIQPLKPKPQKTIQTANKIQVAFQVGQKYLINKWKTITLLPYFLVAIILILVPSALILLYSLIVPSNNNFIFNFSLDNFINFFTNAAFQEVLGISFLFAFLTVAISLVLGYPIAYILAFHTKANHKFNLLILITIPIWTNSLLRAFGMQTVFNLLNPHTLGTGWAIVIGMVNLYVAFMIISVYNNLMKISPQLIEASHDLGANNLSTFRRVILPLSLPGVFTGMMLVFLTALTTLVIPRFLGNGQYTLIANLIEDYFLKGHNLGFGAAIAVIIAIITFLIFAVSNFLLRKYKKQQPQDEEILLE